MTEAGPTSQPCTTAEQAVALCALLERHGVQVWLMGGWGVDALLGRETRPHKDLDLLIRLADLPAYTAAVRAEGFVRRYTWSESRPIAVDGEGYDSAFVDGHPDGRELDVHVVDVQDDGTVVQLHDDPWPLPDDALSGVGTVAGRRLPCVSRSAQLGMHTGYELPDKHREDVRLLS